MVGREAFHAAVALIRAALQFNPKNPDGGPEKWPTQEMGDIVARLAKDHGLDGLATLCCSLADQLAEEYEQHYRDPMRKLDVYELEVMRLCYGQES